MLFFPVENEAPRIQPWEKTRMEYLGHSEVRESPFSDDQLDTAWSRCIASSREIHPWDWVEHPIKKNRSYAILGSRIFLSDLDRNEIVAADYHFFPLCRPDLSGNGYGADLKSVRSLSDMDRSVTFYTPGGFRAAVSAHRQIVEWALMSGKDVPVDVMADYRLEDGRLVSEKTYGIDEHNAAVNSIRDTIHHPEMA